MVIVSFAGKDVTSVKPALAATFFIVAMEKAVPMALCYLMMVRMTSLSICHTVIPGMGSAPWQLGDSEVWTQRGRTGPGLGLGQWPRWCRRPPLRSCPDC